MFYDYNVSIIIPLIFVQTMVVVKYSIAEKIVVFFFGEVVWPLGAKGVESGNPLHHRPSQCTNEQPNNSQPTANQPTNQPLSLIHI